MTVGFEIKKVSLKIGRMDFQRYPFKKKARKMRKKMGKEQGGRNGEESRNLSVKMAERGCVSRDLPNFAQKTANSSFLPQMMYIMAHF